VAFRAAVGPLTATPGASRTFGLGCAPIGNLYREVADEDASATVHAALDHGIRFFDTAPHYGAGASELRLGRALRGVDRDTVAIATKLARRHGDRLLLLIGSAGLLVGGAALAFGVHTGTPIAVLVLISAVLGVPNGFNGLGNQLAVYRAAPPEVAGAAAGLFRTSQYVGANLAAAAIALVFAGPATDAGLHRLGLLVGGIAVILLLDVIFARKSQ